MTLAPTLAPMSLHPLIVRLGACKTDLEYGTCPHQGCSSSETSAVEETFKTDLNTRRVSLLPLLEPRSRFHSAATLPADPEETTAKGMSHEYGGSPLVLCSQTAYQKRNA